MFLHLFPHLVTPAPLKGPVFPSRISLALGLAGGEGCMGTGEALPIPQSLHLVGPWPSNPLSLCSRG